MFAVNSDTRKAPAPALLTPKEAAHYLAISLRKLYTLPLRKVKIGAAARYEKTELDLFISLNATRPSIRRAS